VQPSGAKTKLNADASVQTSPTKPFLNSDGPLMRQSLQEVPESYADNAVYICALFAYCWTWTLTPKDSRITVGYTNVAVCTRWWSLATKIRLKPWRSSARNAETLP